MAGTVQEMTDVRARFAGRFEGQGPAPAWLRELRRNAFDRFAAVGFPHHKQEGWRQTPLTAIAQTAFEPRPPASAADHERLTALPLPGVDWQAGAIRLVFVDGFFAPTLSSTAAPAGCTVQPLSALLASDGDAVRGFLSGAADFRDQPLVALNTAFLADGAWIDVAAGADLARPIVLVYFTTGTRARTGFAAPRTLVRLGAGARALVVETHAGCDGDVYFSDPVTELQLGDEARLEHVRIEQESQQAWHVSQLRSRQGAASRLIAHSINLGGALVRNNVHAILDGEGAECTLNGLLAIGGAQHVDNNTILDHAQPLGTSREYYKGVLDGRARGIFNGRIIVRPGAQHTDAIQSNKNLLLSTSAAEVNSQPQLEIYADDVRCTHGATVGQLDEEALFYLRSRALGEAASRRLLIYAFAADVLDRIQDEGVRARLEAMLFARWAQTGGAED